MSVVRALRAEWNQARDVQQSADESPLLLDGRRDTEEAILILRGTSWRVLACDTGVTTKE